MRVRAEWASVCCKARCVHGCAADGARELLARIRAVFDAVGRLWWRVLAALMRTRCEASGNVLDVGGDPRSAERGRLMCVHA